jgi:hypothetical protein
MNTTPALPFRRRIGPALTLVLLAPLCAEVLPGATRLSSIFVLPIEMAIWGGGALLIREARQHLRLGWLHTLFLAFGLVLIEECLVQQTSLAPLVIQIVPGEPYARAFGLNYLYFLWALGYEATFVVFVPILLTELVFRDRRDQPWLRRPGRIVTGVVFLFACIPAWYSWTQIARVKIFHQPPFTPPAAAVALSVLALVALMLMALAPMRRNFQALRRPLAPPSAWVLGVCGFIAATLWYFLVVLAFRLRPEFPPGIAVATGLAISVATLYWLPRFAADPRWSDAHRLGIILGTMFGSMCVSFAGFIEGAAPLDLYGKIVLDVIAAVLLVWLALSRRALGGATSSA